MSSRSRPVILSPIARHDLETILAYSAENWGESQEVIPNDRIFDAIDAIEANAFIGERQDDLLPGMRCFTIRPHRIFYLVDARHIEILRVVHSKMNLATMKYS